ncbi:hypothetical protein OO012_05515 [Rhodobacteraceae bacterium KMM 6894]|nr:hypothetical protein [Rhodobacteraceae bacterium KMM 6894]
MPDTPTPGTPFPKGVGTTPDKGVVNAKSLTLSTAQAANLTF